MLPAADQVPVAGSYNSADVRVSYPTAHDRPPPAPCRPEVAPRCDRARGVPIDPVGIQTPPGPATGIGLADGAADSLGLGDVASGDAVATAIDRWFRHRRDDGRQPQKAGARRQRPTDEQQGCGREKRHAATPAEPSGRTRRPAETRGTRRCRRSRPGRSTLPRTDQRSRRRRNEGRLRGAARTGRSHSSRSSPRSRSSRRESRPRAPDEDIPSARPISSELSSAT